MIELSKPQLIYSAQINEATSKWGIYCLPRLWREPNGDLVIFVSGEMDCPVLNQDSAPDMCFISHDNGETFTRIYDFDKDFRNRIIGDDPPFLKLKNGNIISLLSNQNLKPIEGVKPVKIFPFFKGSDELHIFKQKDLKKDCYGATLYTYDQNGKLISGDEVKILDEDIEIVTYGKVIVDGQLKTQDIYAKSPIYTPYIHSIKQLDDDTLLGICVSQNPNIGDRLCQLAYLMESKDFGKTWVKRSLITNDSEDYFFGLVGDGSECSLSIGDDGTVFVLTRLDFSIDHPNVGGNSDCMLFVSNDKGYTFSKGKSVADSSVTPHIIALKGKQVIAIYGRPGVHIIYSNDNGKTFSQPISVIGKTLTQELNMGRNYMLAKYFDMESYSNSFIEKLSDNEYLILYTDMKYNMGDNQNHKAGFVRKIIIK